MSFSLVRTSTLCYPSSQVTPGVDFELRLPGNDRERRRKAVQVLCLSRGLGRILLFFTCYYFLLVVLISSSCC